MVKIFGKHRAVEFLKLLILGALSSTSRVPSSPTIFERLEVQAYLRLASLKLGNAHQNDSDRQTLQFKINTFIFDFGENSSSKSRKKDNEVPYFVKITKKLLKMAGEKKHKLRPHN